MSSFQPVNANSAANSSGSAQKRLACRCSRKVIFFFIVLLALAVGLILGAVFAPWVLYALAAVIVFAAIMAIAIVALLIYRRCEDC